MDLAGDVTLKVLMGGFIGSVLGGLVTGLAVAVTIRHERSLAVQRRLEDAAVNLAVVASGLALRLSNPPYLAEQLLDPIAQLRARCVLVMAIFQPTAYSAIGRAVDELADRIADAMRHEDDTMEAGQILSGRQASTSGKHVGQIEMLMQAWLADPKSFAGSRLATDPLVRIAHDSTGGRFGKA